MNNQPGSTYGNWYRPQQEEVVEEKPPRTIVGTVTPKYWFSGSTNVNLDFRLKTKHWVIITVASLLIVGAVLGGVFGSQAANKKPSASSNIGPSSTTTGSMPTSTIPVNTSSTHGNETGTFSSEEAGIDWRNQNKTRSGSQPFKFAQSFASAPNVSIGITYINIENTGGGSTIGLSVYADAISEGGFTLNMVAVGDTVPHIINGVWMAVPPYAALDAVQYQTGHYSTLQSRDRGSGTQKTLQRIPFPYKFGSTPEVIVWIDGFEMVTANDWRMKAYATDIDMDGFVIHVDTWNDTQLYVGNASWLAFPATATNIVAGLMQPTNVHDLHPTPVASSTWADIVSVDWPEEKKTGRVPQVLEGFSMFDEDNNSFLRISTNGSTTADGMVRQIGGFAQSKFRDGIVSYLGVF